MNILLMAKTTEGDNVGEPTMDIQAFNRRVIQFGEAEGQGTNSRGALGVLVTEAAKTGLIKPKTDELLPVFNKYAEARSKAQFTPYVAGSSDKQQVSKLVAFAKLGALPKIDGVALLMRTASIVNEMMKAQPDIKWPSAYDQLLNVARYQVRHSPTAVLSDDIIKSVCSPKPKGPDADEADKLEALRKAMEKILKAEEVTPTEETADMLSEQHDALAERIKALGGTRKQREALEKAQAKADAARAQVVSLTERVGVAA